jgi:hypothetical protein
MFCANCGNELDELDNFCPRCGVNQKDIVTGQTSTPLWPFIKLTRLSIIIASALTLFVFLYSYLTYNPEIEENNPGSELTYSQFLQNYDPNLSPYAQNDRLRFPIQLGRDSLFSGRVRVKEFPVKRAYGIYELGHEIYREMRLEKTLDWTWKFAIWCFPITLILFIIFGLKKLYK